MAKITAVIPNEPGRIKVVFKGSEAIAIAAFAGLHPDVVIAKKRPRKRGDKLPAVTRQQVVTWDAAQEMLKYVPGSEANLALALTNKTAFYKRDYHLMAMYGHSISWPGRGPYNAGTDAQYPKQSNGVERDIKKRAAGDPQAINALRNITVGSNHDAATVSAQTQMPTTTAMLAVFCCEEVSFDYPAMRQGIKVPHGKNKWLHCLPQFYGPATPDGFHHAFKVPNADHANCKHCKMAIVELDAAPYINWSSLLRPCPPNPGGGGEFKWSTGPHAPAHSYGLFYSSVLNFEGGYGPVGQSLFPLGTAIAMPPGGNVIIDCTMVDSAPGDAGMFACVLQDAISGVILAEGPLVTKTVAGPTVSSRAVTPAIPLAVASGESAVYPCARIITTTRTLGCGPTHAHPADLQWYEPPP